MRQATEAIAHAIASVASDSRRIQGLFIDRIISLLLCALMFEAFLSYPSI